MTRKLELRKDRKLRKLKLYRIKRIAKYRKLRKTKNRIRKNLMLLSKTSLINYRKKYRKTLALTSKTRLRMRKPLERLTSSPSRSRKAASLSSKT